MATPRVLIVDDATFTRDLVKKAMRGRFPHFKLDEASNGKQAQQKIGKERYHMVLCDWEMPEMTGGELLAWLRSNTETAQLPFIMITSRGDKEHVVEAIQLGVSNYVVKPFTTDKLIDTVLKVFQKTRVLPPDALTPPLGSAPATLGNDSASVLLQAGQKREAGGLSGALPIADASTGEGTPPPARPPTVRISKKLIAQIRFGDATARCLVKEIGPEEMTAVLRRDGGIPAILDLAVFDFDNVDGSGASRINAFVQRLEARDASRESEFINITLRFVDDDEEKRAQLARYIAAARS